MRIDERLKGRWISQDNKVSLLFTSIEQINSGGNLTTIIDGEVKHHDFAAEQDGDDILVKFGENMERRFQIISLSYYKMTIKINSGIYKLSRAT